MLILLPLLASCGPSSGIKPDSVNPKLACAGWEEIFPSKDDVLTDRTAKQVLAHNCNGPKNGCWTVPPGVCPKDPAK